MNHHVSYELACKGTGVEEGKYEEYHFPNDEEIKEVKKSALKDAVLVIKKDGKEIKRYNLWEFKNVKN
ncbi:hypothetical protein [Ammoniphilus resinae]|uniref:Uncharacterized protein n=1 Tax=Ammoniphilus resinae TaxID=861532 RepID=A0ABS4GQ64_9BACL|nr:hypothetical protein [Ammoniphilus resinae]MBP1932005.1 hypothetical protein [Ammoniphilus resinae]